MLLGSPVARSISLAARRPQLPQSEINTKAFLPAPRPQHVEGQEGRGRQCSGSEGAPGRADGRLWKTGSGVVAALSQPPCYEGRVRSQALSLSQAGCPQGHSKAQSVRGAGDHGPPGAGEAGRAGLAGCSCSTARGRGASTSPVLRALPLLLPRAAPQSQGGGTGSLQSGTGSVLGRPRSAGCGAQGQLSAGLLAKARGAWLPGAGVGGWSLQQAGVGEASVGGVDGCVCMRTCLQVSAGVGGQEQSFQDLSCRASSQNLPCFSLSMW